MITTSLAYAKAEPATEPNGRDFGEMMLAAERIVSWEHRVKKVLTNAKWLFMPNGTRMGLYSPYLFGVNPEIFFFDISGNDPVVVDGDFYRVTHSAEERVIEVTKETLHKYQLIAEAITDAYKLSEHYLQCRTQLMPLVHLGSCPAFAAMVPAMPSAL
tara:strand:- start:7229 stop:7702 length:474 start_codon:yes stop_codon:yes gene_type:complete